jgi:hypothetical protein
MTEHEDILNQANNEAEEAFDLSDVEAIQIGAGLEGRFLMEIVDAQSALVKSGDNQGQPKIVFRLKAIEPASNKPVFKHAILTGTSKPFTKGFLEGFGVDTSRPIAASSTIGARAYCTLSVRKDRPGDSNIDAIEKYDGGASELPPE